MTFIWTPEVISELERLWTVDNWSASMIGKRFGITRSAVIGKARRLGLKKSEADIRLSNLRANPTRTAHNRNALVIREPMPASYMTTRRLAIYFSMSDKAIRRLTAEYPKVKEWNGYRCVDETDLFHFKAWLTEKRLGKTQAKAEAKAQVIEERANVRAAEQREAEEAIAVLAKFKPLMSLNRDECRWSMKDDETGHYFCALPVKPGKPYCVGHCGKAFAAGELRPLNVFNGYEMKRRTRTSANDTRFVGFA